MISHATVPPRRRTTYEAPHRRYAGSVVVRQAAERADAARLARELIPLRTPVPGFAPQKLAILRQVDPSPQQGGGLGDVAALMVARPEIALRLAEHLMAIARQVAPTRLLPLRAVLRLEARADAEEDDAQDALRDEETEETLVRYVDAADEALVRQQAARDAAARRLAELRGSR